MIEKALGIDLTIVNANSGNNAFTMNLFCLVLDEEFGGCLFSSSTSTVALLCIVRMRRTSLTLFAFAVIAGCLESIHMATV